MQLHNIDHDSKKLPATEPERVETTTAEQPSVATPNHQPLQRMMTTPERQALVQRTAETQGNRAAAAKAQQLSRSAQPAAAQPNATPSYHKVEEAPRLIYVNNPEQLSNTRVASAPHKKLVLEVPNLLPGKYRVGYEHENLTGGGLDYIHGIKDAGDDQVHLKGEGHVDDQGGNVDTSTGTEKTSPLGQRGNLPLTKALNQSSNPANQKNAAKSSDPFLSYEVERQKLPASKGYFSGMAEFEVTGKNPFTYIVAAVAAGGKIDPGAQYVGPLRSNKPDDTKDASGNIDKRTNNRQNRVYNGVAKTSEVEAEANFDISDSTATGATLSHWKSNTIQDTPALYTPLRGNPAGRQGKPSNANTDGLRGNVADDPQAQRDVFDAPGAFTERKPGGLGPEDYQKIGEGGNDLSVTASGKPFPPNLGGYWTVYRLAGSVTNSSSKERTLTIFMKASSPNLRMSLRAGQGAWRSLTVQPGSESKYFEVKIPAGNSAPIQVEHMIAGPSSTLVDFEAKVTE